MDIEVKSISQTSPDEPIETADSKIEIKEDSEKPKTEGAKTAIIVCHGMGEQLKFETLNCIGEMLIRRHDGPNEKSVRLVNNGEKKIPRCEITLKEKNGKTADVHLYEIYWAPITEGRITYWETFKFLFQSTIVALKHNYKYDVFKRRVFGGDKEFKINEKKLNIALGIILAILVGIFLSSVVASSYIVYKVTSSILMSTGFFSFLKLMFLNVWSILIFALIYLLLFCFTKIRRYVGDVAAYISPYKVSKFAKIREEVQDAASVVSKFVYGLKNENKEFTYDRIFYIGHSLGSLIAYDALNNMINIYMDDDNNSSAAERTKLFLTFGSPLDKTAFIFRTQKDNLPFREALAEATQPLIHSYKYRTCKWVNIYSPKDIISATIDYYDNPLMQENDPDRGKRVLNIEDKQCKTFLLAHNEYWDNDLLANVLYSEI